MLVHENALERIMHLNRLVDRLSYSFNSATSTCELLIFVDNVHVCL